VKANTTDSAAPPATYATPMQNQRHETFLASKREARRQKPTAEKKVLLRKSSDYFRVAFRALARPVRVRSPPSYEEWLASLAPGSDATLETYYALQNKDNLRKLYKAHEKKSAENVAPMVTVEEDTETYQVDAAESQVYHSWLSGLQTPSPSLATHGESSQGPPQVLEGSTVVFELDENSQVGRLSPG
jgi:hypothetical protein